MEGSRTYCGVASLEEDDLKESSINHKVELKYYKTRKYKCDKFNDITAVYGIQILKKEYNNNIFNIETNTIDNISSNSKKIISIIEKLKKYKVTPIGLNDVLDDLLKEKITE